MESQQDTSSHPDTTLLNYSPPPPHTHTYKIKTPLLLILGANTHTHAERERERLGSIGFFMKGFSFFSFLSLSLLFLILLCLRCSRLSRPKCNVSTKTSYQTDNVLTLRAKQKETNLSRFLKSRTGSDDTLTRLMFTSNQYIDTISDLSAGFLST